MSRENPVINKLQRRYLQFIVGTIYCSLLFLPLAAQTASPGVPVSPRRSALGGLHAADLAGFDSIFTNPAGLA